MQASEAGDGHPEIGCPAGDVKVLPSCLEELVTWRRNLDFPSVRIEQQSTIWAYAERCGRHPLTGVTRQLRRLDMETQAISWSRPPGRIEQGGTKIFDSAGEGPLIRSCSKRRVRCSNRVDLLDLKETMAAKSRRCRDPACLQQARSIDRCREGLIAHAHVALLIACCRRCAGGSAGRLWKLGKQVHAGIGKRRREMDRSVLER